MNVNEGTIESNAIVTGLTGEIGYTTTDYHCVPFLSAKIVLGRPAKRGADR
jgi:hypothetical protein